MIQGKRINNLLTVLLIHSVLFMMNRCADTAGLTLVRNGKTDYIIHLDPSAPSSVRTAAEDLAGYFEKVTGASPELIESEPSPASPFISLGNTSSSREAGLDVQDIPNDGYRILTRNGNLYIIGPDTPEGEVNSKGGIHRGTSNGVYTFIEDYLGVRWLMPGETGEEYDPRQTLRLPELDRTESSPFDFRVVSFRDRDPLEAEWDRRMKLGRVAAVEFNHSWIETVPPGLYKEHPEWFAMENGKRVPPIGKYYKLESTDPELVRYFARQIMKSFREDPDRRWYSLSPSDGGGWSDSPESMALVEPDRHGSPSRTPLVLKFYNDVARIVGEKYPDHMLGGLLYGNIGGYRAPPSKGLKIESNLALMIPNGPAYGFRLYRQFAQDNWADSIYIPEWSELSKQYGFDIYYNDYLITLVQPNGIICPAAPNLLSFTFSGLARYGFKGGDVSGNPIWPVYGPGNYILARLFWDPHLDANEIMHDYCSAAYGQKAGRYIEDIYHMLDTSYSNYYKRNLRARWQLEEGHLEGIYAPRYRDIEDYYLKAVSAVNKPSREKRLELFGQVLSLLQWNLKDYGHLPADYRSPLTLTPEEIDRLLAEQGNEVRITRRISYRPEKLEVEEMPALPDIGKQEVSQVPVKGGATLLLHALRTGEVNIQVSSFDREAEFIQYLLTDAKGVEIGTGMLAEGRAIRFQAEAGETYYLKIPYRNAFGKVRIDGASAGYYVPEKGLRIAGDLIEGSLSFYFYVPQGISNFNITLGSRGPRAEVYDPGGRISGRLDNSAVQASSLLIRGKVAREGFWKIVLHDFEGTANLSLDENLPPWLITDAEHPLKILTLH